MPTMGALHAGHRSLLRTARADAPSLVASVFVNPRQFGAGEDFERYPRDEQADLELLRDEGVDLAFLPSADAIYPLRAETRVDPGSVGRVLEGAARPGHFVGVATVVTVLFGLVAPTRAYFGQKDGQQAVVIRRVVRDLALPVEIRVLPTVREPDGLAVSSRNRYLNPEERRQAAALSRALSAMADAYSRGERDADALRSTMRGTLREAPLGEVDYVSLADAETLEELVTVERPALASLAVRFPSARLIDCMPLPDTERAS